MVGMISNIEIIHDENLFINFLLRKVIVLMNWVILIQNHIGNVTLLIF